MTKKGVDEASARLLVEAGAVRGVSIEPAGDRWAVVLRVGMEERPVCSVRESVRTWANLDTIARWLRNLGIRDASIRVQ